jgi:hypothetical protein
MWRNRSDGTMVKGLSNTRRVMPYLMRGRNEAAVYASHDISLPKTDAFIREWNQANPMLRIDVFHLAVWALRDAMLRNAGINRFVMGGRLYDRKGIWFSYAVKQRLEIGTPLVVVKRRFDTDESFAGMVTSMNGEQASATAPNRSTVDKELGLLMIFPGFVRRILMAILRGADRLGMLPKGFIEKDPMYASAFFANMASFGMPAVYHHLYEYGTAGVFCSIGRPVPEPGSPTAGPDRRRTMQVKWTFDERCDDGLAGWYAMRRIRQILEDPIAAGLEVQAVPGGQVPETPDIVGDGEGIGPDAVEGRTAPVDS